MSDIQTSRYFGWSSYEEMMHDWTESDYDYETKQYTHKPLKQPVPQDKDVLFAAYDTPAYEGSAIVVFKHDGKLYEANGSHCSCYGLEGQWEPEETTMDALKMRQRSSSWALAFEDTGNDGGAEARQAWQTLTGVDLSIRES